MPDGLSDDAALSDAFRAALLADLRPLGALQDIVAERIVIGLWRSLRGVQRSEGPRDVIVPSARIAACRPGKRPDRPSALMSHGLGATTGPRVARSGCGKTPAVRRCREDGRQT